MALKDVTILLLLIVALALSQGCTKQQTEEQLLKSATLHHKSDEFDDAISDFQLLIEKYPKSSKVPEALYAMGVIYRNKKKEYRKAESLYTMLVADFPDDPTAQSAAYQRARIFVEDLHQPDSARKAYELFLQRYPDAVSAPSARSELDSLIKTLTQAK
jgi:TolA-binding protein